jgi:APA family basic amino acid/polyamine antiporter
MNTAATTLRRSMGRIDLVGLLINSTVGAGILGLPGRVFALVGSWDLAVIVAAGALMMLTVSCFAEAGSRFTRTGGVYLYVLTAFGARTGFLSGWLSLLGRLLGYGAIANLAASYTAALVPEVASPVGRVLFITALTVALMVPVWQGIRMSALTNNIFSAIKLSLLLGFCLCAIPALVAHGIPRSPWPPIGHWGPSIILLFFALGGAEGAVVSNGEMRDPARDLPFALLVGMACVIAIYAAVLLAAAAASIPDLAHSDRPVFDGVVRVLGPSGGVGVIIASVISMAGVMFGILFGTPRGLFAMAEAGHMPIALASKP